MRAGSPHSQSLRIAAVYAIVGACWILFSDRIANALVRDPGALLLVNTLKGWFFIAVTALLLHLLVRRQLVHTTGATAARAAAEAGRARAEGQRERAREEALAAGQRLALATRAAHIGTWELDVVRGTVLADEQMSAIYGYRAGEAPGTLASWLDRIHPGDREILNHQIQAALEGTREYHPQFRLLLPDGQIRHVEGHASVQRGPDGRPLRLIGVNRDITERILAEQRYRLLADNIGDVLWTLDLETRRFTYISPSVEKLSGYTAAEALAHSLEDCLAPASLALVNATLPARVQAFLAGDPGAVTQTQELEQYHRNGSTVWTEIVTTLLHKPPGGIEVLGVTRDISQRRAAQVALNVSAQRLRHAEELAGIGHWSIQLATGLVEGSAGAARIYGLTPARWDIATVQAIPLPEYRAGLDEALRAFVAEGRPYDAHFKIRRPDTGAITSIHSRAEYDTSTHTIFGVFQDVTAQEQALEAVRSSEAKLRLLVSNAPVVLFQIDAAGIFRMSEGRGLEKLGLRPGQVEGQSVFEVYRDFPEIVAQVRAALAGQTIQGTTTIGSTVFETFYYPLLDADGRLTDVIGLAVDVTARKQAEAQLRLRGAALEAAAHAIAITDARGSIEWVNPAFTKHTGYSSEEALGRDLGKLVQSGQQTADFYRHLWATMAGGDTWHGELVNRRKDGALIAEEETITPVRDEQGRIAHYIAIKQDITERRRLQEQVLRSQRLDSVGRLAGGIAHDLNNILVPILMAPSLLRETVTDPAAGEILNSIETSANRGAAIIRQLLTFSRGSGGQRVPVQLRGIVGDMASIIRETFPKDIRTSTDLPAEPWPVEGDPTQLHQVLMNLCVNARDAMPEGGGLTIALENVELDAAAVAGHPGASPGPHMMLGACRTSASSLNKRELKPRILISLPKNRAANSYTFL
jgi:PAS domain S-box-containing protein